MNLIRHVEDLLGGSGTGFRSGNSSPVSPDLGMIRGGDQPTG